MVRVENEATQGIGPHRIPPPQGLPADVKVAHKIGTLVGVYADAGIVFAPRPFVLVIMTKGARENEALEVLPKITQVIWEYENKD